VGVCLVAKNDSYLWILMKFAGSREGTDPVNNWPLCVSDLDYNPGRNEKFRGLAVPGNQARHGEKCTG